MINRKLLLALPAALAIGFGGLTATSVSAQSPSPSASATASATAPAAPTGAASPTGTATSPATATAPATAVPTVVATATPVPAIAQCPAGASITLTAPTATQGLRATISPANLNIKLAGDGDPNSFHLHYIVDRDPFTFLVNGQPIPNARDIVHTNSLTPDLSALLTPGRHQVWAILGRQNHVACAPMVIAMVDFAVGAPGAPGTGTDMVTNEGHTSEFAIIAGALLAALAGGALVLRRR